MAIFILYIFAKSFSILISRTALCIVDISAYLAYISTVVASSHILRWRFVPISRIFLVILVEANNQIVFCSLGSWEGQEARKGMFSFQHHISLNANSEGAIGKSLTLFFLFSIHTAYAMKINKISVLVMVSLLPWENPNISLK